MGRKLYLRTFVFALRTVAMRIIRGMSTRAVTSPLSILTLKDFNITNDTCQPFFELNRSYFFRSLNFCTNSTKMDDSVTVISEKMMRFKGIYVSDSAETVKSVNIYAKASLHLVIFEIINAKASSPLLEPPQRIISPTPTPTNIAPKTAAKSGSPLKLGNINGNSSHSL